MGRVLEFFGGSVSDSVEGRKVFLGGGKGGREAEEVCYCSYRCVVGRQRKERRGAIREGEKKVGFLEGLLEDA